MASPWCAQRCINAVARSIPTLQDAAFRVDLAALYDKHHETATQLLGPDSAEYKNFMANLTDDISNLKAMLKAISIGEQ